MENKITSVIRYCPYTDRLVLPFTVDRSVHPFTWIHIDGLERDLACSFWLSRAVRVPSSNHFHRSISSLIFDPVKRSRSKTGLFDRAPFLILFSCVYASVNRNWHEPTIETPAGPRSRKEVTELLSAKSEKPRITFNARLCGGVPRFYFFFFSSVNMW